MSKKRMARRTIAVFGISAAALFTFQREVAARGGGNAKWVDINENCTACCDRGPDCPCYCGICHKCNPTF